MQKKYDAVIKTTKMRSFEIYITTNCTTDISLKGVLKINNERYKKIKYQK